MNKRGGEKKKMAPVNPTETPDKQTLTGGKIILSCFTGSGEKVNV